MAYGYTGWKQLQRNKNKFNPAWLALLAFTFLLALAQYIQFYV